MQKCPLCGSQNPKDFPGDGRRTYFRCQKCALIFVDRTTLLSAEDEKARYELHQNNPQDTGYQSFLARLIDPLVERLGVSPLEGLDFGCGPGPTLSVMMEEMGYCMTKYDPFFFPDTVVLDQQYDFVACTEAIEHFHFPGREWKQLVGLVKPGGWLGIMTKLVTEETSFTDWYYAGDPTHVCFFSRETFRFLAESDGLQAAFIGDSVILLQRGT